MKKLFSLLALVGVFAACQPEELETAFEVSDAVATITVTTIDINTGNNVDATISASDAAATVAGNVVTLKGSPALTARTVTVTASYQGKDYSTSVNVQALLAGGKASYNADIYVGVPVAEQEITYELVSEESSVSEPIYFTKADGHALVDHAGKYWAENLTEFLLKGEVEWTNVTGSEFVSSECTDPVFDQIVKLYADAVKDGAKVTTTKDVLEITVSAWAYYTVYQTVTTTVKTYGVFAGEGENKVQVGSVVVNNYSSAVQYEEIANPMGHGHYQQGHGHAGHGHGDGGNAGGGIVWGE